MITLATKITILRILLVPVCLSQLIYCAIGPVEASMEMHRLWAFWLFTFAAISDGVDGFIARHYQQQSRLGSILDPLADKMLLLATIIFLAINPGQAFTRTPLWFPILVVSRDVILMAGALLIHVVVGEVKIKPRIVSKLATVFQMITLGLVILNISPESLRIPLFAAGFFTAVSFVWYIFDGARQFNSAVQLRV